MLVREFLQCILWSRSNLELSSENRSGKQKKSKAVVTDGSSDISWLNFSYCRVSVFAVAGDKRKSAVAEAN